MKTNKKRKQQIVRRAIFAMLTALLLLATACTGGSTPNPSASQTATKSAVTDSPTKAAAEPAAANDQLIAAKQQADKVAAEAKIAAAAQVAAAKHVDNTLTQLGYGADKGWKTTMTAADWAKVAANNPGYMVQGTSFAKTPEEAAAVAVNNSAVAGTQAQKADPANWKLVYNDQCMVYPSMAYQDQNGNIFWGSDFRECGVAVWVNVASGGSFRLLCDNATKVAPVATPLPASLPQVAPNPAVVPPVVHKPKPPVVVPPKPPVMVKFCIKGSGDQTLQSIERSKFDNKTMTTDITLCVKKVEEVKACIKGSGNTDLVVVNPFNPETMSTNPADCVKPIEACIRNSGDQTLKPITGVFDPATMSTDPKDCVKPVTPIKACIKKSGNTDLVVVDPFDPATMSTNPADCAKPIMACVIGSGNQNLVEVPADYNHDIYSTDIADCVSTCACEHPPVERCDVTTWTIVSISQEEAKNTDRYKDISADACKPPVEECPPGQTPNPNYPATSPDKCLEKKDTDPGNYHTNPGVPPVAADPAPSAPGLDHTTTETGGRGDTVVDTPTNTDPTAPSGVTAPGATEPNATPVTQVNEGGATETDGTNSGTVTSNPIDAPTVVTPPAASAPVDDSAAQAAPTTAPTAATTAPDAPVMAAVTAPADNG